MYTAPETQPRVLACLKAILGKPIAARWSLRLHSNRQMLCLPTVSPAILFVGEKKKHKQTTKNNAARRARNLTQSGVGHARHRASIEESGALQSRVVASLRHRRSLRPDQKRGVGGYSTTRSVQRERKMPVTYRASTEGGLVGRARTASFRATCRALVSIQPAGANGNYHWLACGAHYYTKPTYLSPAATNALVGKPVPVQAGSPWLDHGRLDPGA
ncbi:hypothetical protein ON010_g14525 [Phytophthora cinnamomi]|nr:hypothetical protein ON010_g14525 [Phytophthora cinnamomi]